MSRQNVHTLASLFGEVGRVEIPIVQRDYAQGRPEERYVREAFLAALGDALRRPDGDPAGHLNLDFVYGSFDEKSATFAVLDGQQRLTTLFLLHWYCSLRDDRVADFRARFSDGGQARFTYATRESAAMFFDALVRQVCALPAANRSLATTIRDSQWFFLNWEFDPTVQACLGMLDAIHAGFHGDAGLYARLTDERRITFEFLNLPDFGLSDDLYIKMNARGKPLTPFENFKAWLVGRHTADAAAATEFDRRMDQEWLEVFWQMARVEASGPAADELFMRFFYLMALYGACQERGTGDSDWLTRLNRRQTVSHAEFARHDSFGEATLARVSTMLDYLAGTPDPGDMALCRQALLRNDLMDVARFGSVVEAVCAAALAGAPAATGEARRRWNRVTVNLIGNARIDDVSTLQMVVRGTAALAAHFATLYEDLAEQDLRPVGFDGAQLQEEKTKVQLILQDGGWEPVLEAAEAHEYFQGRVGFLLQMSRDEAQQADMAAFKVYAARAGSLFARQLRESDGLLLERALLSQYDYLPGWSFSRYSFCLPGARSFRDRGDHWLRVVGDARFKDFLDALGSGDAQSALENMIATSVCTDWRRPIIAEPGLIAYCGQRFIKRRDGRIYLISKVKSSSRHVELCTYALYLALDKARQDWPFPAGVVELDYTAVTDGEPSLSLTLEGDLQLRVVHDRGALRCFDGESEVDAPGELADWIVRFGPATSAVDTAAA